MTPGIFKECYNDLIASETMRAILIEASLPFPRVSTPIEIQHDMVQTPRFSPSSVNDKPPKVSGMYLGKGVNIKGYNEDLDGGH